jgi:SAM-dependent methyltransferase
VSWDARAWDDRYAASEQVWSREPNAFVARELADLPPAEALDLACGEGRNAIWLAERGWRVTAIDFSQVAVDRGRRTAGEALAVTWVVGDVLAVPLPPADLAVLAYLQLPADQRRAAVRRAFAALRPGGTLLVVAHDSTNLAEGTGGPQDPAVLYTAGAVLDDLGGEPFEVVRAGRVPRTVTAADDHRGSPERTAWDALVRVVRTAERS